MNSTQKFCLFTAVTAIILVGCEKNELITDFGKEEIQQASQIAFTAEEQMVLLQMRNKDNKIGIEEATQLANEVIGFLDGETATKSGKSRSIASIVALHGEKEKRVATKSGEDGLSVELPDTLAYLFNFADSTGYTIIAADTRIESPILCYTGNGTLKDSIDNPGMAIFLEGAGYYIERSIIEAEQRRDSLIADILAKIEETGVKDTVYVDESEGATKVGITQATLTEDMETHITYSYGPWTVASRVGPLLPVEWSQGYPFNELVKYKGCTSGSAPAGCVATATAQIMAYWSFPSNIDGYNMNWSIMNSYTARPGAYDNVRGKLRSPLSSEDSSLNANQTLFKQNVSRLMERIGYHVSMNYGCKGSGATTSDAVEFLRSLGFTYGVSGYFNEHWELGLDYNSNDVLNSLNHAWPVIADGFSQQNNYSILWGLITWETYEKGHAWVIDGYLRRSRQVTVTVTTTTSARPSPLTKAVPNTRLALITTSTTSTYTEYSPYFLHNNWGWQGSDNGFYVAGTFDSNHGEDFASGTKSGEDNNYQFHNEIYPNIYH
ncbi:hypothetical protein FACS189413_07770 [Bacteroidia bacterium]|nr:hypothetical protein FACS189413_07770 [Bacteroidia bacterium]